MSSMISCPSLSFRSRKKVGNSNPEVEESRDPAEPRGCQIFSPGLTATRTSSPSTKSSLRSWCTKTVKSVVQRIENVGAVVYTTGMPPGLASPTYEQHEASHIVLDLQTISLGSPESKSKTARKDLNEKSSSSCVSRSNSVSSDTGIKLPRRRRKPRGALLLQEESVLCSSFHEEFDKFGSRLQTIHEHGPFIPIQSGMPFSTAAAAAVANAARRRTGGLFKSYRNLNRVSSTRSGSASSGRDGSNSRWDSRARGFHLYRSSRGESPSEAPLHHASTT